MIAFQCKVCGQGLSVPDDAGGKLTRCKRCQEVLRIPEPTPTAPPPPRVEPPPPADEFGLLERLADLFETVSIWSIVFTGVIAILVLGGVALQYNSPVALVGIVGVIIALAPAYYGVQMVRSFVRVAAQAARDLRAIRERPTAG